MTASSDNGVCVEERERDKKKTKRERKLFCQDLRVLYHYPALCCCLSSSTLLFLSFALSLVSSALLSSHQMEQSMQIARVNRARDRSEGRRGGGEITQASSVSPQPVCYSAAAIMSGRVNLFSV